MLKRIGLFNLAFVRTSDEHRTHRRSPLRCGEIAETPVKGVGFVFPTD
jgi:hypothetical protein